MGKKKRSTTTDNIQAIHEYDNNTPLSIHDLRPIKPLSEPQKRMFESYFTDNFIVANGTTGTGKTFAALYLALNDMLSKERPQNHIKIVRSAVPAREIGFLPGDENEKLEIYETPYKSIFADLLGKYTAYEKFKRSNKVSFESSSFVRGQTWEECVVVVDEVQNMTFQEINSIITRIGRNSKLIVVGDSAQNDLYRKRNDCSGMAEFIRVANMVSRFDVITFTRNDIIREKFVKEWICAVEDLGILPV